MRRKFQLELDPTQYVILGRCTRVSSIDDVADFREVNEAFRELQFGQGDVDGLFSVVAGVLALGNATFRDINSGSARSSEADSNGQRWLDIAANVFQLDPAALQARVHRSRTSPRASVRPPPRRQRWRPTPPATHPDAP